jgi:hypothetical protein
MSPRRLTHVLIALLAVLGLSALPAASASTVASPASAPALEDGEFIDEAELAEDPYEYDAEETVLLDDELADEGDVCGVTDPAEDVVVDEGDFIDGELIADDGDPGVDEQIRRRQVTDPAPDADPLDPDQTDEEIADDGATTDDLSDDELNQICETAIDDVVPDEVATTDVTKIKKKGVLTAEMFASGKGVLHSSLTVGAAGRVAQAGRVTIRIKLTKRGRKVLRKATRTLHLTLTTKLALAGGKTVKRTKTLTIKPSKKRP